MLLSKKVTSYVTYSVLGLVCAQVSFAESTRIPATPIGVELDGTNYILTSRYTSYAENSTLLEAQPWWEGPELAINLADAVKYQLGTSEDSQDTNPADGSYSARFAYTADVSLSWDGAGSCNDCHSSNDNGFYAVDITDTKISPSIVSVDKAFNLTAQAINTVIHGAHSNPLSKWTEKNTKTFWAAGDWGKDTHQNKKSTIGLSEFGGGYNFGTVQINLSLGKTWANQSMINNGDVDADGKYLMIESIIPASSIENLYTTLGIFAHKGKATIKRGYLVSGLSNISLGSPNTDTWGVKARLDWKNQYSTDKFQFSPYVDLSYIDIRTDSYTETDGILPATFNSRDESRTELHLGTNASMPIANSSMLFVTNFEIAHLVDRDVSNTSGHIFDVFSFNINSQDDKSTWFKAGVGLEGNPGIGKLSAMLHATTEGQMPTAWIATSWQIAF